MSSSTQLARWYVSVQPTPIVTAQDVANHLRLQDFVATDLDLFIAAATDYAQDVMSCSLGVQTIVATFFDGEAIILPRGPVSSIVSVVGAADSTTTNYTLQASGNGLRVALGSTVAYPISVTYVAGYASVPAAIRLAIMQHVGTLNANRNSANESDLTPVPHSLDAFYLLKGRSVGVG